MFKQLYFRQAMMYLNNQAGMAKTVNSGYGYPIPSGVPPQPPSQWVSSQMKLNGGQGPYAYNPSKGESLLAAHGWKKVGGMLTCESRQRWSNCGAGIAKGTQAKFSILYTSGITSQAGDVSVLKSGFALAGIQLAAQPETFNTLLGDTVPCKPIAVPVQVDVPVPGRLAVQRTRLRADRRAAVLDRFAEQLGQLLRPEDGQADRPDPHQQQHRRFRQLRQLLGDPGSGAVPALGHRRAGGEQQPA